MMEITGLSKATLNNLAPKSREEGIKHKLQGRKRNSPLVQKSSQNENQLNGRTDILPVYPQSVFNQFPTFNRDRTYSNQSNTSTVRTYILKHLKLTSNQDYTKVKLEF